MNNPVTDENEMEELVKDFINREARTREDLPPVQNDTLLIESGILDSLSILKLVLFMEEKFALKIEPGEVIPENFESVDTICRLLRSKLQIPPE
jgi:acyl carrier protein